MCQLCCFAVISNDKVGVVERCGKFSRTASPGCQWVCWPIGEAVAGYLTNRIVQLDVDCETKTKDNVFVTALISVQYQVKEGEAYNAFYKLSNPEQQMRAYVYDVVRSSIPKINLDDVFDSKDEIARNIKQELGEVMPTFGYSIIQALVTDINPDEKVKRAMNEINAASRLRVAAKEKAEGDKILVVKAAEAEAEQKYLQGVGISRQRQAIIAGLQESVVSFSGQVGEITPREVLNLMLMTQYFDALRDIGSSSRGTVFVPTGPSAVNNIGDEIRNALLQANAGAPGQMDMSRKAPAQNPAII